MARKKTKKNRGTKTHGRGSMKKGRGAGERGGRGKAGWDKHKIMHAKKVDPDYFGRHGFKRPPSVVKKDSVINVEQLKEKYPSKQTVDLTKEGIDKLLGAGFIDKKLKVKVDKASDKAIKKIEEAGGEVILQK
ncbi:MAG: uL15 family ribosomal protein [Candidatus Thermoplasmatota archaeon]